MKKNRMPNFLFIGPDKTGSTWMFEILRAHPQCFVPMAKDLYFFDKYYDLGIDWYSQHFNNIGPEIKAIGELSHDYMFSDAAAERIYKHIPDVKLITCLRNPVERTFSHYLYLLRSGMTSLSFSEALEVFPELINNSCYSIHLNRYFDYFSPEKLLILMFSDLKKDSVAFAKQIFNYLDIEYYPNLPYENNVRPASVARSTWLAKMMKVGAGRARDYGLASMVGKVKHSKLTSWMYKPYGVDDRPILSIDDQQKLEDVFAPDFERLQGLLGRSFKY